MYFVRFTLLPFFFREALHKQIFILSQSCFQKRTNILKLLRTVRTRFSNFHQKLGCTQFQQPKLYPLWRGLISASEVISLDEPTDHRPVFIPLCFLCLNKIRQ